SSMGCLAETRGGSGTGVDHSADRLGKSFDGVDRARIPHPARTDHPDGAAAVAVRIAAGDQAEALKIRQVMFGSDYHGDPVAADVVVEQLNHAPPRAEART